MVGIPKGFSLSFQQPLRASVTTRSTSQRHKALIMMQDITIPTDLILSSGYCAFARQVGVLAAVEDFKIPIDRCVGTSSGSLAASLYCRYVVICD